MSTALSGMIAIELRAHAPGEWRATYYPLVDTAAGRMVDINLVLHEHALPAGHAPDGPATWLEAGSPDPAAPCYAGHCAWAALLAAGYDHALAVYDTETVDERSSIEHPDAVRAATVLVDSSRFPHELGPDGLDLPERRLLSHFLSPIRLGPAGRLASAAACRRN